MALPNSLDNQITAAMKTRFESIAAGGDYNYAYEKVYDDLPGGNASVPESIARAINLRDNNQALDGTREQVNDTLHDVRYTKLVDIIGRGYTGAELRKMLNDVMKSIGQDLTWGGLAFHTEFVNARRNGRDAYENIISDWTIEIDIIFRKNAWSL
ncbi:MAG: hypothetical protein IPL84_03780 [Chitinophagaceae bacterium]|nr:hypothetical protein [Chitinophagaceae bacterium]